jgi:hypothetical protein|tara:strand:- start:128 stop:1036 length:909 start_codon:yes stop_codon:yes gene_type:complete
MSLNVYYDLKYAPATFDFAHFLSFSNAVRQDLKSNDMSINIICEQFRQKSTRDKLLEVSERKWRVNHILLKLANLIPEVSSVTVNSGYLSEKKIPSFPIGYPPHPGDKEYTIPYSGAYLRHFYDSKHINLRPFRASEQAKNYINNLFRDDVITITLRNSEYQPKRNSNLEEWYKVYQAIKKTRFRPIVIPCFEDCMKNKSYAKYDWEVWEPGCTEIDLRLALYEKSHDNLCINNGTSTVLIYSNCKYHMFKLLTDGYPTTKPEFLMQEYTFEMGESPIFSSINQHFIWEDDTAINILKHLDI